MQQTIGFFTRYGTLVALLLLCVFFSIVTYGEQHPTGEAAAMQLAPQILAQFGDNTRVLVVARDNQEDGIFANRLSEELRSSAITVAGVVSGEPRDARKALDELADAQISLDVIACNQTTASWLVFADLARDFPAFADTQIAKPHSYWWPNFLKPDNLLNVANQIAVIAILAVGMTIVIITGGIDLSVGSLIALSAVLSTLLIRDQAGALSATTLAMTLACAGAILVCGVTGGFSGVMVTWFGIPPFIVTLAMMLVASGLAFIAAEGQSIYQVPESFVWLGRGSDLFGVPNAVTLMLLLYLMAHLVMSYTVLGRYIYAVGSNRRTAFLCGVPVRRVIILAYVVSGLLAGVGGVVMASQLRSGSPTYGRMYELYVIAAVVVGGTSLSGGHGTIVGTLIGAFIIAVIRNGMNLTSIESYAQNVILGLVILGAVLLDKVKDARGSGKFVEI